MLERALVWLDEASPAVRRGIWAALGLLVLLLGELFLVGPVGEGADRTAERAARLEERLVEDRRLLRSAPPDPGRAEARLSELRSALAAVADSFPAGLRSGVLTEISRMAEEAGARVPIFNLAGVTRGPGELPGFRLLTVEGEFRGDTRTAARFLERLRRLPVPVLADSALLTREIPINGAYFRFRILAPLREGSPRTAARVGEDDDADE